ncbi:MAG: hypothetical protein IT434_06495 [Phycisphaerales bacterium]|jgi:hypothetical protein|nr:hypothetical protein [Phycisphaerales bacterium]
MRIGQVYNPASMAALLRQTIADNVARRAALTRVAGTSLSQVSAEIRRAAAQAQAARRAMFHLDITV